VGLIIGNAVYVDTVECKIHDTCADEKFYFLTDSGSRQFDIIGLTCVAFFMMFLLGSLLMVEASPNKYRAHFRDRIARLRRRLPEGAADRENP
jgi:hypothetical protein